MAKSIAVVLAAILVLVMVATVPHAEGVPTCASLVSALRPCIPFLKGQLGPNKGPPTVCCTGAGKMNSQLNTTPARKSACACLKSAAKSIGVNNKFAQMLPKKCGVKLNVPFTTTTDCSKVK